MALRMRTHTEYVFQNIEELQRVVGKAITYETTKRSRISNFLWAAVCLVTTAFLLLLQTGHWVIALIFGLLGLFFLVRGIFFYQFVALGVRISMDKSVTGSDFLLEKSYMLVTNNKGSSQYPYNLCHRLLETEKNLYFIMKNGQGLILDKANLKGGSVEELRTWMEEKCGKKSEWMGKNPRNT